MRHLRAASVAVITLLTAASPICAQQAAGVDRRVPRLEWGVFGGLAPTGDWLGINEEYVGLVAGVEDNDLSDGFGIGTPPIFGTSLSWFFSSLLGVRAQAAFMPAEFPTRGAEGVEAFGELGPAVLEVNALADDGSDYPVNIWMADLNLVVRPWIRSRGGLLGQTYFFVGGGVLTTDVAGDADPGDLFTDEAPDLVDAYEPLGARFRYERSGSTTGQGTGGFGVSVYPFGGALGLFGELALHFYSAPIGTPARDDPAFTTSLVESRSAMTTRAVLGLKLALGDLSPAPPVPVPDPEPLPTPEPMPMPEVPAPPVVREDPVRVCVVQDGELREVEALYRPASADTVVMEVGARRPFAEAYPVAAPAYVGAEEWFLQDQPVTLGGRDYIKFGVPRAIPATQLARVGEFQGAPVFAETGAAEPFPVVYLPLEPGCRFQPYQVREAVRVRG